MRISKEETQRLHKEHMEKQNQLMIDRLETRKKEAIAKNFKIWRTRVGEHRASCSLRNFPKAIAEKLKYMVDRPINVSIATPSRLESMELAYSILNYHLKKGHVTPGEIKDVNLTHAYAQMMGGFDTIKWRNELFHGEHKIYLVHTTSKVLNDDSKRGAREFWTEMQEIVRDGKKKVIVVYEMSLEESLSINLDDFFHYTPLDEANFAFVSHSVQIKSKKSLKE